MRTFLTRATLAVLALGAHAACGGANASTPARATSNGATTPVELRIAPVRDVATGSTLTEFQKRRLLGHYSTYDGASGFILDRTVTPWRAKLDGVAKVVTLKQTNQPRPGVKEYTSDDRSVWVRVDEDGEVQLFQGPKQHEGVDVHRDADAEQLTQ